MRQQMYQLLRCLGDLRKGGGSNLRKLGWHASESKLFSFWVSEEKKIDFGLPRGVLGEVLRGILGHKNP